MADADDTRIRAATAVDAEALFGLILELASYEKLTDAVGGNAEALIAESGDEAIGYAIYYTSFSTFECRPAIWLEDLYVRPEHRRGGIGGAMMKRLAALTVERGYGRLDWCALDWNEPALRFYAGLGATHLDAWKMLRIEGDRLRDLAQA